MLATRKDDDARCVPGKETLGAGRAECPAAAGYEDRSHLIGPSYRPVTEKKSGPNMQYAHATGSVIFPKPICQSSGRIRKVTANGSAVIMIPMDKFFTRAPSDRRSRRPAARRCRLCARHPR